MRHLDAVRRRLTHGRPGAGGGAADRLLQVVLPGRGPGLRPARRAGDPPRASEPPRSARPPHPPEPFCNAAEETVRAYLRAMGRDGAIEDRVKTLL
ncbi:MAG: hypothetical protein JO250_20550 [Armatimonadetes bacterium]|nr:hypothetical protein [Armatimonadota bacterium]